MIWVLTAWHVLIIIWLLSIGVYWLALIPATILIVLLGYMISSRQIDSRKEEGQYLMRQIAFLWAWSLFIVGSWSFGDIVWDQNYRWLGLVGVQIVWWFVTIVRKKNETKKLFHRWYYLSSGLVLIWIWWDVWWREFLQLIASRWWLTIGLYSFIIFVLWWIGYSHDKFLEKLVWIYLIVEILYFVMIQLWSSRMIGVLLCMLVLLLLTWYLHSFQHTASGFIPLRDEDQEDFYALLYDTPLEVPTINEKNALTFLDPLGQRMFDNKRLVVTSIALSMTLLLAGTIVRVSGQLSVNQLISMYAILFTYCGWWIITRQWSVDWHRWRWITLVGIITVLYFTVVQRLGSESVMLLTASVPISIWLSFFLLYESNWMQQPLFGIEDRKAWLSWIVLITILVSILFFRLPLSNQLVFALLCMYLWVQGMITRYTRRSLA